MDALRTSGSFSLAHTTSRGAGSWTSPFIVMAMRTSRDRSVCFSPSKTRSAQRKGYSDMCEAWPGGAEPSHRLKGLAEAAKKWLGRAHHEHVPLPPACPHAVERGDAHRLLRRGGPAAYARFR